ncbi:MAG: TonB-dependent receptor plug domain-containing protein [Oligoflexales bacterium]
MRKKLRTINRATYCVLHLFLVSTPTMARDVKIKFLEKGTGVPLKRVEVKVGDVTSYSDPEGVVTIALPDTGILKIFRKGYKASEVKVEDVKTDTSDLFLVPALSPDEVIVIKGEKQSSVSQKNVSIEESRKVAPNNDPAQVVKLLPGVQSLSSFQGDVVVRGSGPQDSKYYVDDLEVPFIFHSVASLSILNPNLLSNVQFDSGGFSSKYGDAMGGVIVLETKSEVPDRPKTELISNIPFYSSIFHERPLGEKDSLSFSIRRSYIDSMLRAVMKEQNKKDSDSSNNVTIVPKFSDLHLVHFHKRDDGYSKLSLIAAEDGLSALVPTDFSDETGKSEFSISSRFVNLGYEHSTVLDAKRRVRTTPQFYIMESGSVFDDNRFNLYLKRFRTPTDLTYKLSKEEEVIVGIDPAYSYGSVDLYSIFPRFDDPTFDFEDAKKENLNTKFHNSSIASWIAIDQQLGDLKVTPEVRVFYHTIIDKTSYDPRIRSKFHLTDRNDIKASVGQFSRPPEPQDVFEDFGNPKLDYQKSIHYILGLETRWNEFWTTEIQTFYKRNYDQVVFDADKNFDNDGSGKVYGVEFFVRRNLTSRFFGWLSYTYSQTRERNNGGGSYKPGNYDQTHVANLVASYKLSAQWDVGGRLQHNTGNPYTPIHSAVYNANLDKYQPRQDDDDVNSERLPDSTSLSLYSNHEALFDTWKLGVKYGVEAYSLSKPVFGVSYNYDYSKKTYQKGIASIPFVEVRGEF